ncbi:hypothetical protein DQ384_13935 [Sphaerisporangium album]|uniref:Uncharacterized protein n=2 Tax=Sphaerisporangium album TaxID=509200 RepID=A0A367FMA9_9ACTN|nr:hypothetical protein DQ384_13935 [Sphaerisporangium album]
MPRMTPEQLEAVVQAAKQHAPAARDDDPPPGDESDAPSGRPAPGRPTGAAKGRSFKVKGQKRRRPPAGARDSGDVGERDDGTEENDEGDTANVRRPAGPFLHPYGRSATYEQVKRDPSAAPATPEHRAPDLAGAIPGPRTPAVAPRSSAGEEASGIEQPTADFRPRPERRQDERRQDERRQDESAPGDASDDAGTVAVWRKASPGAGPSSVVDRLAEPPAGAEEVGHDGSVGLDELFGAPEPRRTPEWTPARRPEWTFETTSMAGDLGADATRARRTAERGGLARRWLRAVLVRLGDIPIRAVYGIGAAIVTAIVVVLVFTLFSGDKPEPVPVTPAQARGTASDATRAPAPTPIAVPPVPAAKAMTVFPASGTRIASLTVDRTAGISYAQYGPPWVKTSKDGFSAGQKAGPARRQAIIGSGPLPGAAPKPPATYEDYRKLAGKAVKWSLKYQPAGSKFAWTVSQRARYDLGWLLGYKVSYVTGGKKHTSQAYVMVIATGKKKPAMLFASVPDTSKALYYDLNMLFWTTRAL